MIDPRLVVEAKSQVAAWEVRLEYLEDQAAKYNGDPLPEGLAVELAETRAVVEHRRGMHRRLVELSQQE